MKIDYVVVSVTYRCGGTAACQILKDVDQEAVAMQFREIDDIDVDLTTGELLGRGFHIFEADRLKFEEDFSRSFFANLPSVAVFKVNHMVAHWTRVIPSKCELITLGFKYYFDTDEILEVKL